jgi:ABC-type lipoprotein export system ATPase subunit
VTPALELQDVFRLYEGEREGAGTVALQGLSLGVRDGEIVVILGPSGSGKSTLLRILAGLDRPSAGSARAFGVDLSRCSSRELASYRSRLTGYAEQHYSRTLSPELTARELVGLRLGLEGASPRERRRRADELLDRVGLSSRGEALPHELSGGEQQRIAVCAALAHGPRLLLADEPTGELDHASAAVLYDVLGELTRAERCTTVIVSHDPESAQIADRIVQIRDGRLASEWARAEGDEESIVVGRGGWLQLPEELLRRAAIGRRATARLSADGVVVASAEPSAAALPERTPAPGRPEHAETAAHVRRLRKSFGRGPDATPVFDGFDADFTSGRLTVVTGRSGSGKTTLLRLLAGLELPGEGEVIVLGTSVSTLDRDDRAAFRRVHVGVVGQDPALVPFLTALENVELGLALRGVHTDAARERGLATLEAVGLGDLARRRADALSAGERERVAIARALAPRPDVLLADEPTARLDQANALAIGRLLASLAHDSGTAVICATHDRCVIEQADVELQLGAVLREEAVA